MEKSKEQLRSKVSAIITKHKSSYKYQIKAIINGPSTPHNCYRLQNTVFPEAVIKEIKKAIKTSAP